MHQYHLQSNTAQRVTYNASVYTCLGIADCLEAVSQESQRSYLQGFPQEAGSAITLLFSNSMCSLVDLVVEHVDFQ